MKRNLALVLVVITLVFSFIGCTTTTAPAESKTSEPAEGTEAAPEVTAEPTATAIQYDDLVIYTNSGGGGRKEWLTDAAAQNGFTITVVDLGGGDIKNRLIAEKNNAVADVAFGMSMMEFEDFKAQDMLVQYVPSWAGEVDDAMKDSDGYYHGVVKQAIIAIYNSDLYTAETAPKDWPDMWQNQDYHGKYNIFGLGGGTSRTILAGIATRYLDPTGELGVSDEGWEAIKQFYQNGYICGESEDFFQNLVDQKVPISMIWGSGVVQYQNDYNLKLGVMTPDIGVPFLVEQVAIINGSKHIETAKAFVDWFGSSEVQSAWAQEFGSSPANKVAMESATDDAKYLDSILTKAQKVDWSVVRQYIEQWVEKIELEFIN